MTQFAEQQFALDLTEPGQSSKRTHLESVERQTGKRPAELDGQECPYELEYLMYWWSEIHDGALEEVQAERDKMREGIRYWSYCTNYGMRRLCPEKSKEFTKFMDELSIAPYKRNYSDG